jgi:hypothetical protein
LRTLTITATAAVLALTACTPDEPTDQPTDAAPGTEEEQFPEDPGPTVIGLDTEHDFGDGLVVRLTDVQRATPGDFCDPGEFACDEDWQTIPHAWFTVEATNGSDQAVPLSHTLSSCAVDGREAEQGHYDEMTTEPPDVVNAGSTASYDAACEMDEDAETLAYTLEIYDTESVMMYPPVTFEGPVD